MVPPYLPAPPEPRVLDILGLPLHRVSADDVHHYIACVIENKRKAFILNLNIHCVNLALQHAWLKKFLNEAQLIFCDGDGVRWGVQLLGDSPPPKITYDRWIWQLADFCAGRNFSFFFLGAKPGVADEAARRLKERFPNLEVKGTHHGYFPHAGQENERVVEQINSSGADILVVGFGMPLQEKWLSENGGRLKVHIFLTGGAVFDYAASRLKSAPVWMIKVQMEWLFRLIQEPRRLFTRYAFDIPYFFLRIFFEILKRKVTLK